GEVVQFTDFDPYPSLRLTTSPLHYLTTSTETSMFPLFLDMTNRLALVVGGGTVGRRKAGALLQAGARVRLVCLESRPADQDNSRLEWLQEPYYLEHLQGICLVCAAIN